MLKPPSLKLRSCLLLSGLLLMCCFSDAYGLSLKAKAEKRIERRYNCQDGEVFNRKDKTVTLKTTQRKIRKLRKKRASLASRFFKKRLYFLRTLKETIRSCRKNKVEAPINTPIPTFTPSIPEATATPQKTPDKIQPTPTITPSPTSTLNNTPGISCGDAVIVGTEECDDGNNISGDGCSSVCSLELDASFVRNCPDAIVNPGEYVERDSLSIYDVTFYFDSTYPVGQFANCDFWVRGPVTIVDISPAAANGQNGWEVNPEDTQKQAFDNRAYSYDASLLPSLPLSISVDNGKPVSVVKTISRLPGEANPRPSLDLSVVLTVLPQIPPDAGLKSFRPAYFGSTNKELYPVTALKLNLLPKVLPAGSPPALSDIANNFRHTWLDHQSGWVGRYLHPAQAMPDYGSDIMLRSGEAMLRLMLNDSLNQKLPALINYIQWGIDLNAMLAGGAHWRANGGHSHGRKGALVFAAELLDNDQMRSNIQSAIEDNKFHEDDSITRNVYGIPVWGQSGCSEYAYWLKVASDQNSGSRTCRDPYGLIDGGLYPGSSYQICCNSKTWVPTALALELLPELRQRWNSDEWLEYVERWVHFGAYSQPDHCAPYDGDMNNYGITFGPDGNGGCILDTDPGDGTGRFPNLHGESANQGGYSSSWGDAMYAAYHEVS